MFFVNILFHMEIVLNHFYQKKRKTENFIRGYMFNFGLLKS